MTNRLSLTLLATAAVALPLVALAQMHDHSAMAKAASTAQAKAPRTVEMVLTDDGVTPTEVKATKGEPLRLAITRKTDATCVKQVVVQDYGINQPLPLNQTVVLDITPKATGKVRLLCGMGMTFGVMVVQ